MNKAARKLSQGKRAWFRAVLLVLFVAEAVAFNRFIGAAPVTLFALITGAAALLLLPFAIGTFRSFLPFLAFYAIFLFAFAGLNVSSHIAADRASRPLLAALHKVKIGMTHQQVQAVLSDYEQEHIASSDKIRRTQERQRAAGMKDWKFLGCGNPYHSETKVFAITKGPIARKAFAFIGYDWNERVDVVLFCSEIDDRCEE